VLVLSFAATEGAQNCVAVNGTPYVYARTAMGSFVLAARCPHRGGPLHLATIEPGRARLVCPWHGRATPFARSLRSGTPAVRRGYTVTAVFPDRAASPYAMEHRPLSPDLRLRRAR